MGVIRKKNAYRFLGTTNHLLQFFLTLNIIIMSPYSNCLALNNFYYFTNL